MNNEATTLLRVRYPGGAQFTYRLSTDEIGDWITEARRVGAQVDLSGPAGWTFEASASCPC